MRRGWRLVRKRCTTAAAFGRSCLRRHVRLRACVVLRGCALGCSHAMGTLLERPYFGSCSMEPDGNGTWYDCRIAARSAAPTATSFSLFHVRYSKTRTYFVRSHTGRCHEGAVCFRDRILEEILAMYPTVSSVPHSTTEQLSYRSF